MSCLQVTSFCAADFTRSTLQESECKIKDGVEYLTSLADWSSIPTVNRESLDGMKDGCLVRYVGMVQDVLNPEYFPAAYDVRNKLTEVVTKKLGRYRDVLECAEDEEISADDMRNQEIRHPLFCIPIPGRNSWTAEKPLTTQVPATSSQGIKRPYENDIEMEVVDESGIQRLRPENQETSTTTAPSFSCDKYYPLPETGGLACIVKHYGEEEDWRVNTRIEVVGFLSVHSALEASWQDCDAEDRTMHPPPSLVPRLHAVAIRKIGHCNPLLKDQSVIEDASIPMIRSDLITTLTQLLFGDTLAAEYFLCHLLSSVYARKDGLALGGFSLNLHNINLVPQYPSLLFEFLRTFLPCSAYLPLSIDSLNTAAFVPRKDYESNKLWSGKLQLAEDTHLVVDECSMTEGRLGEAGLRNMAALHTLSLHQYLRYDFTYYKLDFHTNIPTLVLSESKSLIPTNAVVKVQPESGTVSTIAETFDAARFFLSGERLDAVRRYLSFLRMRDFNMDGIDFVGNAWADLRQSDGKLQQDDLHRLLVLSRLLALSHGRTNILRQDWDRAVAMEKARQSRV